MSVNSNCGKTEMRDEYEWVSLTKFGSLFCNRLQHVTSFFPHFSTGEAGRKDQHKPTLLSTCYSYSPFTLDKQKPTCEQAQELTAIKHWGLSTRLRERNPLRKILPTAAASVRRGSAAFPHSPEMFRHILQNTALSLFCGFLWLWLYLFMFLKFVGVFINLLFKKQYFNLMLYYVAFPASVQNTKCM